MQFLVVGLNHRTAPLEIREKLSPTSDQLPAALMAMQSYSVPGVILCTCNRSEFYTTETHEAPGGPAQWGIGEELIKRFLVDHFDISLLDVERYLYVYRGYECVHHLFRVASSLDSMILGEEQIIGQVREAFDAASRADTAQGPLSQLFQQALRIGRKARRETGIGRNAMSVSRACVELAKSNLGDLKELRVMVVGAGDAGGLTAKVLSLSGVKEITVANRNFQRAQELAKQLSGRAIPFEAMPEALTRVDIVISCTGSPGYVLEADAVRVAMAARPDRPLFLIDIAVPRDIDPAAGQIENVCLRDVDDLESVSAASRQEKEREAQLAEQVVTEATGRFVEWYRKLEALPTVIALRDKAEAIREGEVGKTLKRLNGKLTPEEVASIDAMTRAIVNKLLHGPTVYLKERPAEASWQVAREIFRLEDAKSPGAAET